MPRKNGAFGRRFFIPIFAAFSLSTLGVGDYEAASDSWRIITSKAAFAGLVRITTSVTYFVPVLSVVSLQNKIALHIKSMGDTRQVILKNCWDGTGFAPVVLASSELRGMLVQHPLNHDAHPVLHYFHHTAPSHSFKRSIVQCAEAFYLIRYATNLPQNNAGLRLQMDMLGAALDDYFMTVAKSYLVRDTGAAQPLLELVGPRRSGIPMPKHDALQENYIANAHARRAALASLVISDGWSWDDVYRPD